MKPGLALCVTATLILTACTSVSEVSQLDTSTYMVSAESRFNTNNQVAAAGILKADDYCKERGKKMRVTNAETANGVIGLLPPKAVVMFRCES